MELEPFFKTLPIRWGIIGCGNVTEVKSGPAFQQTDGFELKAVMRRDHQKAKDYALRHGIPKIYKKAEDLILDDEIDAVYIATPPDSHKYYGLMVAAAGKPCCIEKPMAPNYEDSQKSTMPFCSGKFHYLLRITEDRSLGSIRSSVGCRSVKLAKLVGFAGIWPNPLR